jgi:hypothetical protein
MSAAGRQEAASAMKSTDLRKRNDVTLFGHLDRTG